MKSSSRLNAELISLCDQYPRLSASGRKAILLSVRALLPATSEPRAQAPARRSLSSRRLAGTRGSRGFGTRNANRFFRNRAVTLLFEMFTESQQQLILRELWRMVPQSRRLSAPLKPARPFAPSGLISTTGVRAK